MNPNGNWVIINHPDEMRKPLLWSRQYKCNGAGYFYDGKYGYFGKSSYARDLWCSWRNAGLGWFGLCMEWRCDGSGKSRIRRNKVTRRAMISRRPGKGTSQ